MKLTPRYAGHLVRRFFGSLRPGGPSPDDEAWARRQLLPGEVELWGRMSGPDRRHAVGVARRTETELGDETTRPILAAALLHDVGKVEAAIGPVRRSLATVAALAFGRSRIPGRMGRYLHHDEIGAQLLEAAGSDPLTVNWAADHHLPSREWSVPLPIGRALKSADDD